MISRTRSTSASAVEPTLALRRGRRDSRAGADLLVVADRPRGRRRCRLSLAWPRRSAAAACRAVGGHARPPPCRPAPAAGGPSAAACRGRSAAACWTGRTGSRTRPPRRGAPPASPQRRVHVVDEGASLAALRPVREPEKIRNSVDFGIAAVTTASTNAIDRTAPVFWSTMRAPAATPRRCGGNGAHHRRRVGAHEHARADADDRQLERR